MFFFHTNQVVNKSSKGWKKYTIIFIGYSWTLSNDFNDFTQCERASSNIVSRKRVRLLDRYEGIQPTLLAQSQYLVQRIHSFVDHKKSLTKNVHFCQIIFRFSFFLCTKNSAQNSRIHLRRGQFNFLFLRPADPRFSIC